ncbi:sn-glycerol-3-phosphate ABC transporter permease UgpE [Acidiferrimicrobium sp. IK]|nr:sn-glycerol-3-phosphate ABC transporter permease UgpE [Acidiferrimicrobium sp. IK]
MKVARHATLIVFAALLAAPMYLAFVVASHPARDTLSGVPVLPGGRLGANLGYVVAHPFPGSPSLATMMLNSLILALAVAVFKLILSVPAAYAVTFFRFPGRMIMFWLIFITLMLPVEVRFFPTYQVTANLGLLNTQGGLILPLIASATAVFLFRQYFQSFPQELADAARLDGIGPIRFLTTIVLPLARPTLAAIFVLEFIYGWNQYLWPLLVTSSPQHSTVVMGIRQIISAAQSFAIPQWDLVMSVALLALLPPVLVVLAMQRWFVRGLMAGID